MSHFPLGKDGFLPKRKERKKMTISMNGYNVLKGIVGTIHFDGRGNDMVQIAKN